VVYTSYPPRYTLDELRIKLMLQTLAPERTPDEMIERLEEQE